MHIIGEIASASGFSHSSLFCKYNYHSEQLSSLLCSIVIILVNHYRCEIFRFTFVIICIIDKVGIAHGGSLETSFWGERGAKPGEISSGEMGESGEMVERG